MPLPAILIAIGSAAAAAGVGAGIHGGIKMKEANDLMKNVKNAVEKSQNHLEKRNKKTTATMDELGKCELKILNSFKDFCDVYEKIHNITIKKIDIQGVKIPEYDPEELKNVSIGSGVILSGLGGAAMGTPGGFAAAGAATAAVAGFGVASTGTAISSLTGAAATNAILAALGGGSLAAGGGGMALGSVVLGVSSAGIGLLVGGIIFSIAGAKLSDKVDEATNQADEIIKKIDEACNYLAELKTMAELYNNRLNKINDIYKLYFDKLRTIVSVEGKNDWNNFTESEKRITENTFLLVNLLYKMCQVKLVNKSDDKDGINTINRDDINSAMQEADIVYKKVS